MKVIGLFLIVLLFSSVLLVYAHPYPSNLTVIDQDNRILFASENLVPKKTVHESIEWFTEEWFNYNFIWILAGVIIVIMTITVLITYREEITPKIASIVKRS